MFKRRTLIALTVGIALSMLTPSQASSIPIEQLAKQVTVRVIGKLGSGSGVIIDRRQTTYTILTNQHVIAEEASCSILTSDGTLHPAVVQKTVRLNALDLAMLEFESKQTYLVVEIGKAETLHSGDPLYAAGFPNYYLPSDRSYLESTHKWGKEAFLITQGIMKMYSPKPMLQGYSLGYTNIVRDGMSGGPVLDRKGRLVGINGRLSYPLQGDRAFMFEDGTQPNQTLIKQMEPLSWAIPVSQFQSLLKNFF